LGSAAHGTPPGMQALLDSWVVGSPQSRPSSTSRRPLSERRPDSRAGGPSTPRGSAQPDPGTDRSVCNTSMVSARRARSGRRAPACSPAVATCRLHHAWVRVPRRRADESERLHMQQEGGAVVAREAWREHPDQGHVAGSQCSEAPGRRRHEHGGPDRLQREQPFCTRRRGVVGRAI
jgi:hypothetical protein